MSARSERSVASRCSGTLASTCLVMTMAGTFAGECAAAADLPQAARGVLSADFLWGTEPLRELLPMSAFTAASDSRPAATAWTGRLSFSVPADAYTVRLLHDSFDSSKGADRSWRSLPEFDVGFVQVDGRLVPTRRGAQANTHGWWEWIVEPGHVWSEPGDRGRSRAAVPFALIEKNANCVHNGVLTFLFGAQGEVSRVALQVAQETCAYFKFDGWAVVPARVDARPVPDADDVAAAWRRELAARLPTAPIEQLARDRPGTDPTQFGSPSDVTPAQMTAYGVVVAGRHYVGGCMGRAGPYPFCDELVLPSYSIAKSVVAGYGLMRLEQLVPGAFSARIAEFVPECAAQDGWQDVSFGHALDMATGRFESTEREADENTMVAERFFYASTHAEKISIACKRFARREPPGRRWVYHTSDTYVLGRAMAEFWRARQGPGADFFRDVIVAGLWRPLQLSPTAAVTRRTGDATAQPFTGWGLTLLRDDFAKLGAFAAIQGGRIDGESQVDPREFAAALQRRTDDPGLPAGSVDLRYNNGFWAWDATRAADCARPLWVPFMSGFGGLSVVLMPGVVYYYVSDGYEFRFARAVRAARAIVDPCESGT